MTLYKSHGFQEIGRDGIVKVTQGTVTVRKKEEGDIKLEPEQQTKVYKGDTIFWGPDCDWDFCIS